MKELTEEEKEKKAAQRKALEELTQMGQDWGDYDKEVNPEDLIGLSRNEIHKGHPRLLYRTIEEDGVKYFHTAGLRLDRFNLTIENGIIVKVTKG